MDQKSSLFMHNCGKCENGRLGEYHKRRGAEVADDAKKCSALSATSALSAFIAIAQHPL